MCTAACAGRETGLCIHTILFFDFNASTRPFSSPTANDLTTNITRLSHKSKEAIILNE